MRHDGGVLCHEVFGAVVLFAQIPCVLVFAAAGHFGVEQEGGEDEGEGDGAGVGGGGELGEGVVEAVQGEIGPVCMLVDRDGIWYEPFLLKRRCEVLECGGGRTVDELGTWRWYTSR